MPLHCQYRTGAAQFHRCFSLNFRIHLCHFILINLCTNQNVKMYYSWNKSKTCYTSGANQNNIKFSKSDRQFTFFPCILNCRIAADALVRSLGCGHCLMVRSVINMCGNQTLGLNVTSTPEISTGVCMTSSRNSPLLLLDFKKSF